MIDFRKNILHTTPIEMDGKPVYVMSPSTEGLYTWLTSRGDDLDPTPPSFGRGEGEKLLLTWTGGEDQYGTKEVELDWMEPIELHDGHVDWNDGEWGFDDEWSVLVRLPANAPEKNGEGGGNCNLAAFEQLEPWDSETSYDSYELVTYGGVNYACILPHTNQEPTEDGYWMPALNIIVPAAEDGQYDIDLNTAVPAPCGKDEPGYWDVDRWAENMTPLAAPQLQAWNLFDFQIELFFMKNMHCGDPRGIWDFDAYKAEWISSRWKLVFQCTRTSPGPGRIGGYLMCFRPGAI